MSDELAAFLRARFDHETADLADYDGSYNDADGCWGQHVDPTFARAEVEAKRRLLKEHEAAERRASGYPDSSAGICDGLDIALRCLAVAYADHPDYNPTWAP